jgi:hypothetical protein
MSRADSDSVGGPAFSASTPSTARYAAPVALRHVRGIALRNIQRSSSSSTVSTSHAHALTADITGTYYTLRAYRTNGSVYAPTPYGEVCVDDYDATRGFSFTSAAERRGRGLNPDWCAFDDGDGVGGALVKALGSDCGVKFELCVYGTRGTGGELAAIGERSASEPRAWKRGLGVVRDTAARAVAGADVNTDDVLICRAAIDLSSLVRVGDRVPSGVAIPANATFIRLADGVYSPAPSSGDGAGDAVRAFLDALEAKTRKEQMSSETVNVVIDRVVVEGDEFDGGSRSARSRRSESGASPRSTGSNVTAAQVWAHAEKGDAKLVDVKTMVANVEKLIDAKRTLRDTTELREELVRRLEEHLSSRERVSTAWTPALSAKSDDFKGTSAGVTADECVAVLTKELTEARESLGLMKDDVGRRIRALRQAGEKLVEANEQLDVAENALNGPNGIGKLYQKQRALVARRWRLVGELAEIFEISLVGGVITEGHSEEYPLMKIADIPLDLGPAPSKSVSVRTEDLENDAAAYGYVAQILIQLAAILDVRLRYPVCPAASRSYICDFHQVAPQAAGKGSGGDSRTPTKKTLTRIEFPLFMETPNDRTKYTYGVFLLNKNLEQLLNAHGLSAVGPRHTLQNLERIFEARKIVASDGT